MKTILISGGTGFIGSNMCKKLLEAGERVICLDNNYTGSLDNISDLRDNPNFSFIQHDVTEPLNIGGPIDQIYNMACPASPKHYQGEASFKTMKTCVYGSFNMLDLALEKGASILQCSTSEIYGEPLVHPQTEEYRGNVSSIGIRACYDEGKRAAEAIFFDYWREKNVKIKVVRIFNTYGPNMNPEDGRVVSNFICQTLRGEDLSIYGDGSQTRSFCYVDDLIEILLKVMNSPDDFTGPVNVGNDGEFTIGELAEKVLHKIGGKSKIVYRNLPADDPTQRKPDLSLARDCFGWSPLVDLDTGLDHTIAYFAKKLGVEL